MNGILIIDKPAGLTSHDVVARVRRVLKTKRVGHTGTLDPFATGVMVILIGQATRFAQFLDKDEKEYEAVVRFGFETDTGDRTGSPRSQVPGPREDPGTGGRRDAGIGKKVEAVLAGFRGEIMQVPPMYSAKKVEGKKLYELARKGETIERKPVNVTISKLELFDLTKPEDLGPVTCDLGLTVACSAGTYIRTLAEDIGRKVGIGAHLAELRRTRAGRFDLSESVTLAELEKLDDPAAAMLDIREAVSHLPEMIVPDDRVGKTRNGMSTRVFDDTLAGSDAIKMVDGAGTLIAIGYYIEKENTVQPKVVLV